MTAAPISVMIIEDSEVVRGLLEHVIGSDARFRIVASVPSAEEGLQLLASVRPDVISLDIRLPGMNGFEFTRQVMRSQPTPIVVVSASLRDEELDITMNALKACALTVVEKPRAPTHRSYESMASQLCTQLAIMSQVRVVRQYLQATSMRSIPLAQTGRFNALQVPADRVLGIVASTGGPNAVSALLRQLGADFAPPVVIVQHMTSSFMDGFIRWLDSIVPQRVLAARHGASLQAGTVYIAPADRHTELSTDECFRLSTGAAVNFQRPSGDLLLRSLAAVFGSQAIGVILTGMGRDGAAGLQCVREAGGFTIAEHESSCVVHGMPAAAVQLGAAVEQLPLDAIGSRIRNFVRSGGRHFGND